MISVKINQIVMSEQHHSEINLKAASIEEVLKIIDWLIERFIAEGNPLGYFAVIYKKTTQKVHDMVQAKKFVHNNRMTEVDVYFANLYFAALSDYFNGRPAPPHWQLTFDAAGKGGMGFGQHFLVAANAHINYDLALTSATIFPGESIHAFEADFKTMNNVLGSLYNEVNGELSTFWPVFRFLMKTFKRLNLGLENLMMEVERGIAWNHAKEIALAPPGETDAIKQKLMHKIVSQGDHILHPRLSLFRLMFWVERITERKTVAERLRILNSK